MSISDAYKSQKYLNHIFYTELGDCRIICNPRGYVDEYMVNPQFDWVDTVVRKY